MILETLTVPYQDLKGIKIGDVKKLDFDEGRTIPGVALLQTPSGDYEIIGKKITQEEMGRRIIASYEIQKINKPPQY